MNAARTDLAARIAAAPSAYVGRYTSAARAAAGAAEAVKSTGRPQVTRIFHGPVGEYWTTASATVAAALAAAGYEKIAEV